MWHSGHWLLVAGEAPGLVGQYPVWLDMSHPVMIHVNHPVDLDCIAPPPHTHTPFLPLRTPLPTHAPSFPTAPFCREQNTQHTHTHTRLVAARLAATYCFVRACFACEGVCNKKKKNGEKKTSSRINLVGRGGSIQLRPGEPDCPFYVKTGSCKFGKTCKFNHPRVLGGHADKKPSLFPSALFA